MIFGGRGVKIRPVIRIGNSATQRKRRKNSMICFGVGKAAGRSVGRYRKGR